MNFVLFMGVCSSKLHFKKFLFFILVMPSKATIFNSKCDVSWELSSGAKNAAYYSFDGLHLALCGFGNVAGNIEVW
jgi:translation initiation factor 2A